MIPALEGFARSCLLPVYRPQLLEKKISARSFREGESCVAIPANIIQCEIEEHAVHFQKTIHLVSGLETKKSAGLRDRQLPGANALQRYGPPLPIVPMLDVPEQLREPIVSGRVNRNNRAAGERATKPHQVADRGMPLTCGIRREESHDDRAT